MEIAMMRALALILVCLSSATAQRYAKLAPFDGLRWNGDEPEVMVDETWYRLVAIDGTKQTEILAFCKKTWRGRWQKRFSEDLVEVLSRMGHPPGKTVDLGVRELSGGGKKTLRGVAMTEARRKELWAANQREEGRSQGLGPPRSLTRAQVEKDVERLAWRVEHAYSYRDLLGVDWRGELAALRLKLVGARADPHAPVEVMKFLARFGDGHTRVGGSARILPPGFLPVLLAPLGDRVVALRPGGGGPAVPGNPYVKSIDGVPVDRWIGGAMSIVPVGHAEFMRRVATERAHFVAFVRAELNLQVKDASRVSIELTDASGTKSVKMSRPLAGRPPIARPSSTPAQRVLEGNVGYIQIPSMASGESFRRWLHRSMGAVKDTAGLVIDVRGNGGGSREALRVLLPYFMAKNDPPHVANVGAYRLGEGDDPVDPEGFLDNRYLWPAGHVGWSDAARGAIAKVAATFKPDWKLPAGCFSAWHYMVLERTPDTAFHYDRPLIILLDTGCFSATDIFLGGFSGHRNVTLLGTRSGGGSGRSRSEALPNSGLTVRMSTMASFRPNGQRYDGKGIAPDVEMGPILSDLLGSTDSVLDAAVKRLSR